MSLNKYKISSYTIVFEKGNFALKLYTKEKKGSTAYTYETDLYIIFLFTSIKVEEKELNFKNQDDVFNFAKEFTNAFTLFCFNKTSKELSVVSDILGAQPFFYSKARNKMVFSTLIYRIVDETNLKLEINPDGLFSYLGFGYCIENSSFLYKNIERVYQGRFLCFNENLDLILNKKYIELPPINSESIVDIPKIVEYLKLSFNSINNPLVGATSGKDSLLIMSVLNENNTEVNSGNFGHPDCSDVIYGKEKADIFNFKYTYQPLCNIEEFKKYSYEIAYFSSGMGTTSYIDMLKFVDQSITINDTFVMGEAGDCVRQFFTSDARKQANGLGNHLTPKNALKIVLNKYFKEELNNYPHNVINNFRSIYKSNSEEYFVDYYRNARMPGNFSLRSLILQPKGDKFSPFLDKNFIMETFSVNVEFYQNSNIHRQIIEEINPKLLPYFFEIFDKDDSQDWENRFKNGFGEIIKNLIYNNFIDGIGFSKEGLIKLINENINRSERSMYLIFRVLSLFLFVKSIRNNKRIIFEEKIKDITYGIN